MSKPFPDPGIVPTLPSPNPGEKITIEVEGLPPYKDLHFSIRNPKHRDYATFAKLRDKAIEIMGGRKWYEGAVGLSLIVYGKPLELNLSDYIGGIEDTLDGSHGTCFTYLPVVFQDDCQVSRIDAKFVAADKPRYIVEVVFLGDSAS